MGKVRYLLFVRQRLVINIDLVILGITIEFEDGEGLFAAAESMGLEGIKWPRSEGLDM